MKLIISECDVLFQDSHISNSGFLNFATIIGPAREGKSSLANYLVGKRVFATASTVEVCTKDVKMFPMKGEIVGDNGAVCFIDTEGQGDEDEDSDAMLLTPVIILSKVIIYNLKGCIQKWEILRKIGMLVKVGEYVSSKSFEDGDRKFGHLFIVLRDGLEGTAADVHKLLFAPEKGRLNVKEKARNQIREKLLASFESIETVMLPPPCNSFQETKNISFDMTSDDFKKGVQELKAKMMVKLSEPRKFGKNSKPVTSKNAQHCANIFVKQIQDDDLVNINNAVAKMQQDGIDKAAERFDQRFKETLENLSIPMAEGSGEKLENDRKEYLEDFKKETEDVDADADSETSRYREKNLQRLEEQSTMQLQMKILQDSLKKRLTLEKCKKPDSLKSLAEFGKNVAPIIDIAKRVYDMYKPKAQSATEADSSGSSTGLNASFFDNPETLLVSLASELMLKCARNPEMITAIVNGIFPHSEDD